MEKSKGRRIIMKNPFCMPKLRGSNCTRKSNRLTPMSVLDRFRQAVFRLIMLSAMSKANQQDPQRSSSPISHRCYYSGHEPHHSEAVADCIEFIKKSATTDDGGDGDSSAGSFMLIDGSSEVVFPVPVMWNFFLFKYWSISIRLYLFRF